MGATLMVTVGLKLPSGSKGRWVMTEILGCGGAMLPWVGVIGGVVYW